MTTKKNPMPDQQMSAAELAAECKRLAEAQADAWHEYKDALRIDVAGCITAAVNAHDRAENALHAAIDALQAAASQREGSRTREVATLTKWRDLIYNGRTFEVSDEICEILRAEKERALTAPATSIKAQAGEGWRPIETAPVGGQILVYMPEDKRMPVQVAYWRENVKIIGGKFSFDCSPVTHWQPLPTPPAMKEDSHE